MAKRKKSYRRSSEDSKQDNSSCSKTNFNQTNLNKLPEIQTTSQSTARSNSQCALMDHLEGKRIEPKKFGTVIEKICLEYGFKVLLEIPSQLVEKGTDKIKSHNKNQGTAIAILCPNKNGYSLLFAICQGKKTKIRVVDEKQASASIVELACSYATVLSLLPKLNSMNNSQKFA